MLNNIYSPLSGALAQERVMEIIANNLANSNTVGFKEERVTFKLLEPEPEHTYKDPLPPANYKVSFEHVLPLRGNEFAYVGVSGVHRDMQQGPVIDTKSSLDLMLEGEGFMTVHTSEGLRYTRSGSLTLNEQGVLADKFGNSVLGKKGVIFLKAGDFQVNHLGEIYQNNELVDRLDLVRFQDERHLEKIGNNLYFYGGPQSGIQEADKIQVRQGFLEGSNVNVIRNLTAMILSHRSYEAYQKTVKNMDSMMEKSSNTIGEVRA
jgi:flagellar basal-body rod protein FlgG